MAEATLNPPAQPTAVGTPTPGRPEPGDAPRRRPLDGRYAEKQTYDRGQAVAPASLPDVVLAVDALVSRVES